MLDSVAYSIEMQQKEEKNYRKSGIDSNILLNLSKLSTYSSTTAMETISQVHKPLFKNAFIAGVLAGIIIAILNNVHNLFCSNILGISAPDVIHAGSITGASIIPALVAGIFYYALSATTQKTPLVFSIVVIVLTLLSLGGPLGATLPSGGSVPNGFAILTLPMHLISGLVCILVIPRYASR